MAQLRRARSGLDDRGLGGGVYAVIRERGLGIQVGRLEAILREAIVWSRDFCGGGEPIIAAQATQSIKTAKGCESLQSRNHNHTQSMSRDTRDRATPTQNDDIHYPLYDPGCR